MVATGERIAPLLTRFAAAFGTSAAGVAAAPGRVNLIGEHTDYNDGFVLPMGIERDTFAAFRPRKDTKLRVLALAYEEVDEFEANAPSARPLERSWHAYTAGVAWTLAAEGIPLCGVDLAVGGDLPSGAGLASSAALELAVARALIAASELEWEPSRMAQLARRAEHRWAGVACGIMDQIAAAESREGSALLLDCRSLESWSIPMPASAVVVVMDTGVRRYLSESSYNERRAECGRAVDALRPLRPRIQALRDVDIELLEAGRERLDAVAYRRALHVVEENRRPQALAQALKRGDLAAAGRLMNDSHASLREFYEVSGRELDAITTLAREHPACYGARMTGAGFGGCGVALVAAEKAESFIRDVGDAFRDNGHPGSQLFASRPAAGARLLDA